MICDDSILLQVSSKSFLRIFIVSGVTLLTLTQPFLQQSAEEEQKPQHREQGVTLPPSSDPPANMVIILLLPILIS